MVNCVPSVIKIVQAIKKLNSISQARLNFRRRPFLCTTLYRNLLQASNFDGAFDQLFLWIFYQFFLQKMPLNVVYTMVQESKKWPKTQIKGGGGPALRKSTNKPWSLGKAKKETDVKSIPFFSVSMLQSFPVKSLKQRNPLRYAINYLCLSKKLLLIS